MECDAFYITVFKSFRFHLSTPKTERFQNDAYSNVSTLKPFTQVAIFIRVFGRFSMDDRRKRIEKYAFSNEITLLWMWPKRGRAESVDQRTNICMANGKIARSAAIFLPNTKRRSRSQDNDRRVLNSDRRTNVSHNKTDSFNWYCFKKAVAVFMRLKSIFHKRRLQRENTITIKEPCSPPSTMKEVKDAEIPILRFTQFTNFSNKIQTLNQVCNVNEEHAQNNTKQKKTKMRKTSCFLFCLDPFSDERLLHVGGRLNNADITEDSKHTIILPQRSHVRTLNIRHAHEQIGHVGCGHVLARFREKNWIIGAFSAEQQVISSCITYQRNRASPQDQKMANLASDQFTPIS